MEPTTITLLSIEVEADRHCLARELVDATWAQLPCQLLTATLYGSNHAMACLLLKRATQLSRHEHEACMVWYKPTSAAAVMFQ